MVNNVSQYKSEHYPNVAELTELKIIRLDPDLPIPQRAHPYDAGIDLFSTVEVEIPPLARVLVGTGIAVDIPSGYVGLVHPRSGLAWKQGLSIVNAPGTIDCGYQGEIKICLINLDAKEHISIHRRDRIAQLLIEKIELPTVVVVEEFTEVTERGTKGYGSTGGHQSLEA